MAFERNKPHLLFEVWKNRLRRDCELQNKLTGFNAIGDYVLRLIWQDGADPTIDAIVGRFTKPEAAPPEESVA